MATPVNASISINHTITHMKVKCNYLELNSFANFTAEFYTAHPNNSDHINVMPVHNASITIKDNFYNDWGSDDNYIITLIKDKVDEIIQTTHYVFGTEPTADSSAEADSSAQADSSVEADSSAQADSSAEADSSSAN